MTLKTAHSQENKKKKKSDKHVQLKDTKLKQMVVPHYQM
jgi:hypothetical protein